MVFNISKHYFKCFCDKCGLMVEVEENIFIGIYNGAQAARSLGWSFGKDRRCFCSSCRKMRLVDKHCRSITYYYFAW